MAFPSRLFLLNCVPARFALLHCHGFICSAYRTRCVAPRILNTCAARGFKQTSFSHTALHHRSALEPPDVHRTLATAAVALKLYTFTAAQQHASQVAGTYTGPPSNWLYLHTTHAATIGAHLPAPLLRPRRTYYYATTHAPPCRDVSGYAADGCTAFTPPAATPYIPACRPRTFRDAQHLRPAGCRTENTRACTAALAALPRFAPARHCAGRLRQRHRLDGGLLALLIPFRHATHQLPHALHQPPT